MLSPVKALFNLKHQMRILYDQEQVLERVSSQSIELLIMKYHLQWFGHVTIMQESRFPCHTLQNSIEDKICEHWGGVGKKKKKIPENWQYAFTLTPSSVSFCLVREVCLDLLYSLKKFYLYFASTENNILFYTSIKKKKKRKINLWINNWIQTYCKYILKYHCINIFEVMEKEYQIELFTIEI